MTKITLTNLVNLQNETTAVNAINANNAVLVAAMDNTLSRDGTSPNPMGATLDMNSQQIINLPAPLTGTSPLRLTDASVLNGGGTIANIPVGGTTNQVLAKNSAADFDIHWVSETSELTAGTNVVLTGTSPTTISTTTTPTFTTINTATIPTVVDTLVGRATTDTLSNKTLVAPALGTPVSGVATNLTGTAAGLTAGNVTTNANLTGDITSVGNATTLASVASSGTTGSSTAIPVVTINAKGLTTGITTAAVIAPASTLSGTTLASGVTASSLTSFGSSPALSSPTLTTPNIGAATGTSVSLTGGPQYFNATAPVLNGVVSSGIKFSSTANLGIYFGSGVPNFTAAQGSLYVRTDGSSTTTRLYVNTTGSTVWTTFTSAA